MKTEKIEFCGYCKFEHSTAFHADIEFMTNYDVLAIIDQNIGNRSVTNDIEYVLWVINKNYSDLIAPLKFGGLQNFRIIYKDSDGYWDKIILDYKGDFVTFSPIVFNDARVIDINIAFKCVSDKAIML